MKNIDDRLRFAGKKVRILVFFSQLQKDINGIFDINRRLRRSLPVCLEADCVARARGIAVRRVQIFRYVGKIGVLPNSVNGARHGFVRAPGGFGSPNNPIKSFVRDPSGGLKPGIVVKRHTVNQIAMVCGKKACVSTYQAGAPLNPSVRISSSSIPGCTSGGGISGAV